MLRFSVVLFTTLCLLAGPVKAQGINPVTPLSNDLIQIVKPAFANPSFLYTTPSLLGGIPVNGAANCVPFKNGMTAVGCDSGLIYAGSGGTLGLNATAGICSPSAGVVNISNTSSGACSSAGTIQAGSVQSGNSVMAVAFEAIGAPPALSGSCSVVAGTQKGGNTVGEFAVPAGACATTTTVILTFAFTAINGYACDAHDVTTPTSIWDQTGVANETTTATFTIRSVNASAADIIKFKCMAY